MVGFVLVFPTADATFTATTTSTGNTFSAATLGAPSGLAATRPCTPAAAPTFVSRSVASDTGSSVTVARPLGVQTGDVLVAFFYSSADDTLSSMVGPSGWTELEEDTSGSYNRTAAYSYPVPASAPASFTFSWTHNSFNAAGSVIVLAYRGADPAAPVATSVVSTGTSSSVPAPVVNVTRRNTVHVFGLGAAVTTSFGTPTGMTARGTAAANSPILNDGLVGAFDEVRPAKGNTAARTSSASGSWVAVSVLVQPPAPDPTVGLTWTPATDATVTGYELTRTGGGTSTVAIPGRTTAASTDSTTVYSTAYTYALASVLGSWRSAAVTTSVAAC
jgi:hypothetical protein